MKKIDVLTAGAVLLAVSCGAATASAQGPCGPFAGYGGYLPYGGLYGGDCQMQAFDRVPYFALNPPVYYSHPVARPYGYSPFALPPGVAPVEPQIKGDCLAQAETNPFFVPGAPNSAPNAPAEDRTTKTAAVVPEVNPFFVQSAPSPAVENLAKNEL
ncbi:MAG TPA: hypothetical protein VGN57_18135 [Pirellulaceae bacterium]|jgi:hypothetical protein|nr:hypothetical protein [Pirellulaceae bacterium]